MSSNPWRHVRAGDVSKNPYVNPPPPPAAGMPLGTPAGRTARGASPSTPPVTGSGSPAFSGSYILMDRTSTYALGVHALQEACQQEGNTAHPHSIADDGSRIYRPLTFKENIEARVKEYNTDRNNDGSPRTEQERLHLFTHWIDSCMGIAYKKKSTKFTLISECEQLITIASDFNSTFMPVSYRSIRGIELNSSARGVTYNALLSQQKVLENPAWKAAVGDDALLREYASIVFPLLQTKYNRDTGMGFFVVQKPNEDQLRALFVNNLDYSSGAVGNYDLDNYGSFLRVAHRRAPGGSP